MSCLDHIITEIQSIQARFDQHAASLWRNGYSEVKMFDEKFILKNTRMNMLEATGFIYRQTGVSLEPVTDEITGEIKPRMWQARITGWAKDYDTSHQPNSPDF